MTRRHRHHRRDVLRTAGGIAVAAALAGCAGDDDPGDGPDSDAAEAPEGDEEDPEEEDHEDEYGDDEYGGGDDEYGDDGDDEYGGGDDGDDDEDGDDDTHAEEGDDENDDDGDDGGDETNDADDGDAAANETVTVAPGGSFSFDPSTLTVEVGTTVSFVWEGGGHNVNVTSQPDGSDWGGVAGLQDGGYEHKHTFETAGDYAYQCDPHSGSMTGEIVVEE